MLKHVKYTNFNENLTFLEEFTIIGKESILSMKGNLYSIYIEYIWIKLEFSTWNFKFNDFVSKFLLKGQILMCVLTCFNML